MDILNEKPQKLKDRSKALFKNIGRGVQITQEVFDFIFNMGLGAMGTIL